MENNFQRSSNRKKAWEEAYNYVKKLILSTKLKPGEIISEQSLAEELGISRTPVREALRKLEQEGLIVSNKRRKQVFILTMKDMEEIFDIKEVLESSIARWAAEKGKDEDVEKLLKVVKDMKLIARKKLSQNFQKFNDEWLKKDEEYHTLLFKMAGNKRAENVIRNLNHQWHRLRLGILAIEGRLEKSAKEHEKIAMAIAKRDPQAAEKAMKEHLRNLRVMILNLMEIFNYP